mmetsp:Transcript_11083/g.46263  ORF Transcript_11083/g.46263 Transcript_11083/m.46263 type:complete len:147 (-) Transcript_11083:1927-2367(-)
MRLLENLQRKLYHMGEKGVMGQSHPEYGHQKFALPNRSTANRIGKDGKTHETQHLRIIEPPHAFLPKPFKDPSSGSCTRTEVASIVVASLDDAKYMHRNHVTYPKERLIYRYQPSTVSAPPSDPSQVPLCPAFFWILGDTACPKAR